MARCCLFLLFLLATASASAQKRATLERKLDIFWNAKKHRASLIARMVSFEPGDTIADIGTADGWFIAALSTFSDNLTFYLEDIDSAVWNRPAFDSAVSHFARIRQKNISHQFHYSTGADTSTGLPHDVFHKVLIIDTYHHFKYRSKMLADAVSLLKPGGKIVVVEALSRRPGDLHHGCGEPIFSELEIISDLEAQGLSLETVTFIHKIAGRPNKIFIFSKP
jgi:ubiquinone/menaquinone biosynthesis C-methylase UbiE